jgi:spoIIIJ-associated protein
MPDFRRSGERFAGKLFPALRREGFRTIKEFLMNKFKNFQGKTLDDAISEACGHYGVPREKLEIEIINDAKIGIFGLVGVKKAEIRAARMQVAETLSSMLDDEEDAGGGAEILPPAGKSAPVESASPVRPVRNPRGIRAGARDAEHTVPRGRGPDDKVRADIPGGTVHTVPRGRGPDGDGQERGRENVPDAESGARDGGNHRDATAGDPAGMDPGELSDLVRSVVVGLAAPIVGEVPCKVDIGERRVLAALDCGEDAGLLVGREGQTLDALQYLAGRIVAKKSGVPLRLQVDAGRYHERREDRLKELAVSLAERVKSTRRAQATRPLSAYQRRLVHLALEHDPDVHTHSKGEGLQRRVFIYPNNAGGRPDPAAGGTRFASDGLPADDAFASRQPRLADTTAAASCADDAVVGGGDGNFGGPDPWNR